MVCGVGTWPWTALALGTGLYAVRKNFYVFETKGASMVPTIPASGGVVLVDRYFWRFKSLFSSSPLSLNDIIIFRQQRKNKRILACKRIVALEGDAVELAAGLSLMVPTRHLWVEGDKKSQSRDSRYYGAVDRDLVLGRVLALTWPTTKVFFNLPKFLIKRYPALKKQAVPQVKESPSPPANKQQPKTQQTGAGNAKPANPQKNTKSAPVQPSKSPSQKQPTNSPNAQKSRNTQSGPAKVCTPQVQKPATSTQHTPPPRQTGNAPHKASNGRENSKTVASTEISRTSAANPKQTNPNRTQTGQRQASQ